ncbi:MAG: hypothetical protein JWO22_1880 [Frankiales bacterium]|nr:hypothetical protein [Frankiales bacterium]
MASQGTVLAHNLGEHYELPLPLTLFVVGGAAVVLLSFLLVIRLRGEATPLVEAPDTVPQRGFSPVPGVLSLVAVAAVAYLGFAGTQEPSESLASVVFWVLLWIAVPLLCGLVGDFTRPVNPFANAARLLDSPRVRKAVLARSKPLAYRSGWWPALVLFVLLVLGELVFNSETGSIKPAFVATTLLLYTVLSGFLGLVYGAPWLERGEVFSVLWNTWGRQGFFRFGAPGGRGLAGGLDVPFERRPSRVLLVLLLLISINFDGLLATPDWVKHIATDKFSSGTELQEIGILVVLAAVVLAVFTGFAVASARLGAHGSGPLAALAGLLPSLVPIAYGYLVAHNLSYLAIETKSLFGSLLQHPLNGNASYRVDNNLVPSSVQWYVGLGVIVAVHVIAVVLAHRHLARSAPDERIALRSEYPWLVAMVAYTAFSLYLIAQPVVA